MNRQQSITAIIATVGRPDFLRLCLESLAKQTYPVAEVIVVHCGDDTATEIATRDERWTGAGMHVRYFHYPERNCAKQRNLAVERATHNNLLLIDDDVEVEPTWVEELFKPIWSDTSVAATMGSLVNQPMESPTPFWRIYRILLHGPKKGLRPGLLVGAALPNGFPITADTLMPCEWIGGGASAVRKDVFQAVGGFAPFFTGSSPGEDLDLGYRLSRAWKVYYVPTARCIHHQARGGRENIYQHQYLSTRSRFGILKVSMKKNRVVALAHVGLWATLQCLTELGGLRRGVLDVDLKRAWSGRLRGFLSCIHWFPETFTSAT